MTRETPAYALTVARQGELGPRLRRSRHNCGAWLKERKDAIDQGVAAPPEPTDPDGKPLCTVGQMSRMADFVYVRKGAGEIAALVANIRADLPLMLVDRTGLVGTFEWDLTSAMSGLGDVGANLSKAPTLDVALQEQLGLRLIRTTAPVQSLVIDGVAMPAPN